MIRDLKLSDLTILEEGNYIPHLFNGPFKLTKSIEYKGKLVASFWVRVTTESSLIFAPEVSKLTKAKVISDVFNFLYNEVPVKLGISDSFIIFEKDFDNKYIEFLKKRFNFEDMGKVLRLRRDDAK